MKKDGGVVVMDGDELTVADKRRVNAICENEDFIKIKNVLVNGKNLELLPYERINDNPELRHIFGGIDTSTVVWFGVVTRVLEECSLTESNFRGSGTTTMKPSPTLVAKAAQMM